jgi:hypothetical protein
MASFFGSSSREPVVSAKKRQAFGAQMREAAALDDLD